MKRAIRDAREARTVLSEPSTPPSSALRYLTFSTPFILYSSVTERERSAPVSARAAARLSEVDPLASPLIRAALLLYWEFRTQKSDYVLPISHKTRPSCLRPGSRSQCSMFRWWEYTCHPIRGCRTADMTLLQQLPPWIRSLGRQFIITHVNVRFCCQFLLSGCPKMYQKAALKCETYI